MKYFLVGVCILAIINSTFAADASSTTESGKVPSSSLPPVSPPTTTGPSTVEPSPSPAPTPSPVPILQSQPLNFNITDAKNKDLICALFSFTGTIRLQTSDEQQENDTIIFLLNNTALAADSSCTADATVLKLNLNGTTDQLTFELDHSGNTYKLGQVLLTIGGSSYETNITKISTDDNKSYLCQAERNFKLNSTKPDDPISAHLIISNLHIDAFRSTPKENDFRQAMQCEDDYPTNDFVPLAVGCALISLVLIVLIAYIVGRRRSKRLSYTSV